MAISAYSEHVGWKRHASRILFGVANRYIPMKHEAPIRVVATNNTIKPQMMTNGSINIAAGTPLRRT